MLVKVWEKVYARLDLVRNHELAQSLSNSFSDPLGCRTQDGLSEGDPAACYARGGMKVVQTE